MSLEITQLTGGYTNKPVIKDINLKVNKGEIIGLIGLNGAGKSTVIKHIMGLMEPFSGRISIDGFTLEDSLIKYRSKTSFIPETPFVYQALTLKEHLEITGLAYDIPTTEVLKRATPLLKRFRLIDKLDWFPQDFSKGMKQKVMIICALIVQADLLIVDEPFIGLDPLAIMDFEELLLNKKDEGKSILLSTHVLAHAEKICDSFVILKEGKVFAQGTVQELSEKFNLEKNKFENIYRLLAEEGSYDES